MPHHLGLRTLGSIAAAVCALAWPAQDALALTLGRIAVQSTLGQPLKAEIEVPGITADEAASLSATVAPLTAYRSAGVDFNVGLSGTRLELQKRGDRTVLVLTGDRTLNDPFVDLIIEATWAAGKVVRNYTVLLDPPDTGRTPPPVAAEPAPIPPAAPVARDVAPAEAAPPSPRRDGRAPASRPAATAPAVAPSQQPAASGEQTVTVKPGDTAARIASAHKPTNVSLDQMLVGLLQQNPRAFSGQNVNRLRAGEVLSMPSPGQLDAISPQEASKTIVAQSRDFNNYRRQLAGSVAPQLAAAPEREARGKVQAQVQESKATPAVPDKLTLSKAGATAVAPKSSEAQIAGSKEAKDQSTRVAELSKNLSELNRLKAQSTEVAGAASATSAPKTGLAAPMASPLPAGPASQPGVAASVPATAAASAAASAPVVAAAPEAASAPAPVVTPKPAAAKAPPPEPGFFDDLFGGSLLPIGGGLLLVLLGFGFLQMRQRQKAEPSSTIYPDSQFDGDPLSGSGRSRDPVSSMGYSPSQLDAAGDVDPVEEADVYLAYGRDMQAEEILKEALQRTPHRLAVHLKLLDIYAKRQDVAAFDRIAVEARALTDGKGTDWDRISAQGHALSPGNPAYRAAPVDLAATFPPSEALAPTSDLPKAVPASVPAPGGLDLSLDFPSNDDTTLIRPAAAAATAPVAAAAPTLADPLPELEFTPDPAPVAAPPAVVAPAPTPAPAAAHLGAMEFDLDSLSLDTSATTLSPSLAAAATPSDPLDVKLELAGEFLAIGDTEGARALVQEVLANSSGAVKARAEQMLADLKA